MIRRRMIMGTGNRLPYAYQRVEYIESTGTQYINSLLAGGGTTKVEIAFSTSSIPCAVFGAQANLKGITLNFGLTSNTRWNDDALYGYTDCLDGQRHDIVYSGAGFYVDGALVWEPLETEDFATDEMFLFRANGAGTTTRNKIYSCIIYENNVIKRNFIPCCRKADNEIGMFDIANNVFYTNAGTGTFLKGNDI